MPTWIVVLLMVMLKSTFVNSGSSSVMMESQRVVLTMSTAVAPLLSKENASAIVTSIASELQKRLESNTNASLVKSYGHRLVWDLGMMVDLERHATPIREAMQAALPLWIQLKGVEIDGLVSPEQLVHDVDSDAEAGPMLNESIEWQFSDSEPFSMQMESVWHWLAQNTTRQKRPVSIALLDGGLPEFMMLGNNASFSFFEALGEESFDFISNVALAGDGDGRDPMAMDPGDSGPQCPQRPHSWHGAKMAAAIHLKNGIVPGVHSTMPAAGIIRLEILRVLGQCSVGYANDVADAIVWASGGQINGLALNGRPANVISMSFSGYGPCPSYLQSAVNQARSSGVILVSSSGNQGEDVSNYFPANCKGVMPIAASTRDGILAPYSNKGALLQNAAPGGDVHNPILTVTVSTAGGAVGNSTSSALIPTTAIGSSFSAVFAAALIGFRLWVDGNLTGPLPTRPFATTGGVCQLLPSQCGRGIVNGKLVLDSSFPFLLDGTAVSNALALMSTPKSLEEEPEDLDQVWPVNLTQYWAWRQLEMQQLMISHQMAADTMRVVVSQILCPPNDLQCPVGHFYQVYNLVCRPCDPPFSISPGNASYLNTSARTTFLVPYCPWTCNHGFHQTLSTCLPGTQDCTNPAVQQPYTTLYACAPNAQAQLNTCMQGEYYGSPTAHVTTTLWQSSYLIPLNLSTGLPMTQMPMIGKRCSTLAGPDTFETVDLEMHSPFFARQSGDHELSLVMDVTFHTLSMVNKTNGSVWLLAGKPHRANLTVFPPMDGIGSNAQFGLLNWIGKGLGMSNDASVALVYDNGLLRRVDIASANVSTLCGRLSEFGYMDGQGSVVRFQDVRDVSVSPDGTFALIADLVVIRYVNISTATVSLLVGRPNLYGSADGVGTNAVFFYPQSVAISNSGAFAIMSECASPLITFVSRGGYPVIRRIDIASARATRIAGRWNQVGHVDGVGSLAFLYCPVALTIASDDSYVLFLDDRNNALRMLNLVTNAVTTLTKYYQSTDLSDTGSAFETPNSISNMMGVGSPSMRAFACYKCPKGQFNTLTSTTSCVLCAAGSFASGIGLTTCTLCSSVGVAAPNEGLSTCLACTPGTFQGMCSPTASHYQCSGGGCAFVLGLHSMGPWNSVGMANVDPSATWIWSIAGAASSALTETITLSRSLYLPACHACLSGGQAPIQIYMVVDNRATVHVNNVLVINNLISSTWNVGTPTSASLNPGLNLIRIQATNDGGPAGLLLTITCAATGAVLLRGDASWCSATAGCATQLNVPVQGAACARCVPGTYGFISRASSCLQCSTGTFSSETGATTCQPCASGSFSSAAGASVCQACAAGQFASAAGSSACSNCTRCMSGAALARGACLQGSSANTVNCSCLSGFYGTGIGDQGCTMCPAFTNTSSSRSGGGTSLLDCRCRPGYTCNYTKTIHLTIRIANMSVDHFTANHRAAFLAAVARAANVSLSKVLISSVMLSGSGTRRDLAHPSTLIAKFQVFGCESMRTDLLLEAIKDPLPVQILWEHGHHVKVRRSLLHPQAEGT